MSEPHHLARTKPPRSVPDQWNAAERQAQIDRVIMRAAKQQERRKVATPGATRRRKGDR